MKLGRIIKYALTIVIFSSLQVTLCKSLSISGITPNIVMPFVVSLAVIEGPVSGAVVGLICGLFADALSSGNSLIHSLTYMYTAVAFGNITTNYLRKNLGSAIMFTFAGTVILEECIHFLHFAIWGVSGVFSAILNPILPTAIYSSLVGIPIYYYTRKLFSTQTGRDYI